MEKTEFVTLLRNYTSLTQEEANSLIAVQSQFPYSQVIHNMCSRAAQDLQLNSRDHLLHVSAVYSTERSVLKSIMTASRKPRVEVRRPVVAPVKEDKKVINPPQPKIAKAEALAPVLTVLPVDNPMWTTLAEDMKHLEEAKHRFEMAMAQLDKSWAVPPPIVSAVPPPMVASPKKPIIKEPADTLMEEIKAKKIVKPEGSRQKEQIEIIESFIKTQPTISRSKPEPKAGDPADLTEEGGPETDHIVSETLVEILLKQGRKDKAIEVLKKLIWKIPQKKAYFAAQIEELKK